MVFFLCVFFNEDMVCYPVYNNDLSKMFIVSYDVFANDTILVHMKIDYLKTYVDSLLDNSSYNVEEHIWSYNNKEFRTLSLIDSVTGELLYDNLLFNVLRTHTMSRLARNNLTRGELSYISGYEEVTLSIGTETATLGMPWSIDGYFHNDSIGSISGVTQYRAVFICTGHDYESNDIVFSYNFPNKEIYSPYRLLRVMSPTYYPYYEVGLGIGTDRYSLPASILLVTNADPVPEVTPFGIGYCYSRRL